MLLQNQIYRDRYTFVRREAKGVKRARPDGGAAHADAAPSQAKKDKKDKIKAESKVDSPLSDGAQDEFKGYKLKEVPTEAWPQPGPNKGAHGYTIKASNNAVIWLSHFSFFELKNPTLYRFLKKNCNFCSQKCGSEAIEVLLRTKAYVVKRGGGDQKLEDGARQWTWSKHGGAVKAWALAKEAANWPSDWDLGTLARAFLYIPRRGFDFGNISTQLEVIDFRSSWVSAVWIARNQALCFLIALYMKWPTVKTILSRVCIADDLHFISEIHLLLGFRGRISGLAA